MTHSIRNIVGAVALALLALLVVVGTLLALLHTDWGTERVRDSVENRVTKQIPGTLRIGAVDDIDLFDDIGTASIDVTDLRFIEPRGAEVIVAESAQIDLDLFALTRGHVSFHGGTVDGGLVLVDVRDGVSTIERTFNDPDSEQTSGGATFDLTSIHVEGLRVVIQPDPETEIIVEDVEGFVRVMRDTDTEGVVVELARIEGRVEEPSLLGEHARLASVDGAVRGARREVVNLDYEARFMDGTLKGNFTFVPRTEKTVRLEVDAEGLKASVVALAANLRTELGGKVELDMK